MANTSGPFGFRQWSGNGSVPTYEQVQYDMAYNATATFFGDPVVLTAAGGVARCADTGASPAALGIAGIFVGCKYTSVAQKKTVWSNYFPGSDVASTNLVKAYVVNDPNARWLAQTDSTGLALADVNTTIGFVIGTGNTATGISGAYLDVANIATSANFPFRVVGIYNDPPGAPGTLAVSQAYDYAIVAFNNITTRNFTGV